MADYGSHSAVEDAALNRPPHHSRLSDPSGRAAKTALGSSSPASSRRSSAKALPDASRFSVPAQSLTRTLGFVRVDAVAWTDGGSDEAPEIWRLLAEALCSAPEHRSAQECVDASLATARSRGRWATVETGVS